MVPDEVALKAELLAALTTANHLTHNKPCRQHSLVVTKIKEAMMWLCYDVSKGEKDET